MQIERLMRPVSLLLLAAMGAFGASAPAGPRVGDRAPALRAARWFNSEPLGDRDLAGKVRLVEFWTFGCINCVRTVPAMRALHDRLAGVDVVVIGVHTPEFERERDPARVREAIGRLGIGFPVAQDNDGAIWRAFHNRYWPALYVVDKRGIIRRVHIGELHQGSPAWKSLVALVDALRREPV